MKQPLVAIVFVLIFSHQNVLAQQSKAASLEKLISLLHKQRLFNGAVVAGHNGKIIYSQAFGFAEFSDSIPFTPITASDGGSNAKTFTAAAILLLVEKGALRLDDPVQKYFENYPFNNTSIFNLITHSTGGLPEYDFYFNKISDSVTLDIRKIIDLLDEHEPVLPYPPNTNFYYDSPGFDIAAAVVEQVSEMKYQEFLNKYFFSPLQMTNSFVRPARVEEWPAERTKGYRFEKDSVKLFDIADREGFFGGSNIWFSATDLYLWGTSFYKEPVLSKYLVERLTSPVAINGKPSAIRLGAWYGGKNANAFYYWGNLSGFYSWVYWDKKQKFTVAFVTNTTTPQWVRPLLTSCLIDIMEGKPFVNISKPKTDMIERNDLAQICGFYNVPKFGRIEIFLKENVPTLRVPSGMEYHMVQVDAELFYVPGLEPWISFRHLDGTRFQELNWMATVLQTVGKRVKNSQ
jgi:CubicO group peptidase (beta-lactamase class C family)